MFHPLRSRQLQLRMATEWERAQAASNFMARRIVS
jgi:hypothetical protein